MARVPVFLNQTLGDDVYTLKHSADRPSICFVSAKNKFVMKKLFLLTAIAVLGAGSLFTSCSDRCNAQPASSDAQAMASASAGVVNLKNDTKYRPGMKVKRLTILDFNATWCGPCKQFAPAFDAAAKKYGNKVDFVSIDVDVNRQTADAFRISSIPTVIFLYPNGKSTKYVGTNDLLPGNKFNALIEKALK